MKKVILIMLVSVLSAAMNFSYAQTMERSKEDGKTRTQVVEELNQARANGELNVYNYNYEVTPKNSFNSTLTREQVKAELKEYQNTHPYPEHDNAKTY